MLKSLVDPGLMFAKQNYFKLDIEDTQSELNPKLIGCNPGQNILAFSP